MTAPPAAPGNDGPDLASLTPLITALVTALAAWKLFEPKFARIRAIKTEMGSLEPGFRFFYQLPQVLLFIVSAGAALFLFFAFLLRFQGDRLGEIAIVRQVSALVQPDNTIWVIFSLGVIAAYIYWNFLSYLLLWAARLLSWLPIPGLAGRFGPDGRSPGWHQARVVCEGPDKGAPLLIDRKAMDRIGYLLLGRLATSAGSKNRANEPKQDLEISIKANLVLFGCILEQEHYDNGWTQPDWTEFYDALGDVQIASQMFSPKEVSRFENGGKYFERLRKELAKALAARGQPSPPHMALAAGTSIVKTWELLTRAGMSGNILSLAPPYSRFLGGRLRWLDRGLRAFPKLEGDGMRPQVLKLLLRWNTLPDVVPKSFGQPFAKRQAWFLLQEHVLHALPEVKEVTFNGTGERAIARIASRGVVSKVVELVREGDSDEAHKVEAKFGQSDWRLRQEADVVLWEWATSRSKEGRAAGWNKDKWHWEFEDGRASRTG